MVEDNEEHGAGAEEDGQLVEVVVGNHLERYVRVEKMN